MDVPPRTELPKAPPEPPALIAGRDLEHYWNETKWFALATVGIQAVVFLLLKPTAWEWYAVVLFALVLAWRVRRRGGDAQYLLAVTGIGGAFTGFGTAIVHLAIGQRWFYLAEFIRLPIETALVAMAVGTLPPVLYDRWRTRRSRNPAPPASAPEPTDDPDQP